MRQKQCSWLASLASGVVGAVALTAIHETARRVLPHPPRIDMVDRRAVRATLDAGQETRRRASLQRWSLAGDIAANTLYYAAVARGRGRARWGRALALGTLAGVGAIAVPPAIGLGQAPNSQHAATQLMTVGWYLAGALASAAASGWMSPRLGALGA